MEGFVYHGSPADDLEIINPKVSTHNKKCVYASPERVVALLFMGKGHGDLDTMIGCINGELTLVERREGVFDDLYNQSGYLYTLDGSTFEHYDFLWSKEVISYEEVKVIKKEVIENIMDSILQEAANGNIKVYHYPDRPSNVPLDNSDLIDKYINFEFNGKKGSIDYLLEIYPEFKESVDEKLKQLEVSYESTNSSKTRK